MPKHFSQLSEAAQELIVDATLDCVNRNKLTPELADEIRQWAMRSPEEELEWCKDELAKLSDGDALGSSNADITRAHRQGWLEGKAFQITAGMERHPDFWEDKECCCQECCSE